jgi:hypothetical protein
MRPPIVVQKRDGIEVYFFEDAATASNHVEAIDVRDGVYVAFDADGLPLDLSAASDRSAVVIADSVGRAPEPETVQAMLRRHLAEMRKLRPDLFSTGTELDLAAASLPRLIQEMENLEETSRQRSLFARLGRLRARILGGSEQ